MHRQPFSRAPLPSPCFATYNLAIAWCVFVSLPLYFISLLQAVSYLCDAMAVRGESPARQAVTVAAVIVVLIWFLSIYRPSEFAAPSSVSPHYLGKSRGPPHRLVTDTAIRYPKAQVRKQQKPCCLTKNQTYKQRRRRYCLPKHPIHTYQKAS